MSWKKYLYGIGFMTMLFGCNLRSLAVTPEELGNPVRDVATHKFDVTLEDKNAHVTHFHYVYFGSYPQREIKGSEITDAIRNAPYDADGDAVVDGKKYRRQTWEMKTTTGNLNETSRDYWIKNRSDNGYRYFLY